MAESRQDIELLFFDTFSHDNAEELNLDLVQFPRPVVIGEVRVIPLQTRVQADVPGGVRLGATNPSHFKLELFVNNLSKPNASTFESLGTLEYKANDDIQMNVDNKIPTDGLILKGWYNTLTIAIYGGLTSVVVEPETLPPPPPPQPRKQATTVQPATQHASAAVLPPGRDNRAEHSEWEPTPQLATPHTTQHPLDYIQQQLQQANIQPTQHSVAPVMQPHPMGMVPPGMGPQGLPPGMLGPGPVPQGPGQMPMGIPPPLQIKQEYHPDEYGRHPTEKDAFSPGPRSSGRDMHGEMMIKSEPMDHYENRDTLEDGRSRDSWPYHDGGRDHRGSRERLPDGRDYTTSREGSRDRDNRDSRDREYRDLDRDRRDYRDRDKDDRDWDRDKIRDKDRDKRGNRERADPDRLRDLARDSKERGYDDRTRDYEDKDRGDRGRGYDTRDPMFEGKRDLDPDRRYDRDADMDRDRGRDYERDRDRDRDFERIREKEYDRGRDGNREREGYPDRARDIRDLDRVPDRDLERGVRGEWDQDRGRDRDIEDRGVKDLERERARDARGFRDRTREDYRDKERAPVYMETEAPRSPSRSRSRSFTPDRPSSRSRSGSPSPARRRSRSPVRPAEKILPRDVRDVRPRVADSPIGREPIKVKEALPTEPLSPNMDTEISGGDVGTPTPAVGLDPLSPDVVGSPVETSYMSDYEAISSEDEFIDIEEDMGIDYDLDEDAYSYITSPFNPYQFEMTPLSTFKEITQTPFEEEKAKFFDPLYKQPYKPPKEAKQLIDLVDKFKSAPHHESWVEAVESVPGLLAKGLSYLIYQEDNTEVLCTLLDWAVEGLDEIKAMAQPESAYKVRHLKMGFKLAGALCTCDPNITIKVLEQDIQNRLLDNFQSKFMSFSLKLQIIAALDQTTRFQDGIEWFLGVHKLQSTNQRRQTGPLEGRDFTGYQRAVQCLLRKQVVRVVVAMTALIKKVHTYEVMNKLGEQLERIVETLPEVIEASQKGIDESGMESEMDTLALPLNESDLDALTACVEEITKIFTLAPILVAQPSRTLPGKKMFEIKTGPVDPYPCLYHMANSSRLLESLFFLVSCPSTSCIPTLFGAVRALIQHWYSTHHGLVYLSSRPEIVNKFVQALIQISDYSRDEVSEDNAAQQLGIELIYHLQTLMFVDKLFEYHDRPKRNILEDQEPITILHTLYTMTFTPLGRSTVIEVLTMDDNINSLLPFFTLTGVEKDDAKLKKSVCVSYTTELLNAVIHHSDNVEFLKKHGAKLLALGESEFSSKVSKMKDWLMPLKNLTSYSQDGLPVLVEQLKSYLGEVSKLPRGLITVLRILRHLAVGPQNDYPDDKNDEMKFKFVLIEMFSADCFSMLFTILQKICDIMLRPWQKGIPRSSDYLTYYISIIKPCLEIIKTTTQYLILSRGTEFRDLTALPVLFELHTVLCSVPASSMLVMEITALQREIIDTIAAYTQPLFQLTDDSGEKISQSLWTLAVRDLLKYTMKAPYTYLSGLQILSELLPLPLPLQTREPLSKEDEEKAINTRKLWSAHLLPLHGALHNIIRVLSVTSCQQLQQIIRKICLQMSDLAAVTATMITQCLMDILLEHMECVGEVKGVPETDEMKVALATRGRFLNLLAYLLSQPAIKCTMLRLMGSSGEEKYDGVLRKMLDILNLVSERPDHVQDQECVVSILQSLCDMEVTLTGGETALTVQAQVANALPTKDQLTSIIEALLEHIAHPNHKYDTVLPCIRALVMLTEHDYSFYLLRVAFDKHKLAMYRLLQRIKFKFSKDSSDCLSTFSTTLEFLRLLVSTDATDEDIPLVRTITLSNQELREVVAWSQNFTNHPLVDLQKLLEDGVKEEETLESLLESVTSLLTVLKKESPFKPKPVIAAPTLPEPEPLTNLFNIRSTYTVTDPEDERLSSTFWQTTFEPDEPDLVQADLDDLCRKYCNDLNVEEELKKDIGLTTEEERTKPKKLIDRRKSQEFVTWRGRGMRRPFVAPMRGRGIARGLAAQANRHDPFRSRPPNTSRPPSMHVDDFMKLEQKSEQHRDDAGDDSPLRRDDFARGRGRGFDGGRGFDRGRGPRFFTPPTTFRRDGGGRGGREEENAIYDTRHERPMAAERRDRGGRFEHRGRSPWRGGWSGSRFKEDRFQGGVGFRGGRNDPNRHQRSFTK